MKKLILAFLFVALILQAPNALAQQVTPFYRPGDTLRLAIAFDGPDTAAITTVQIGLYLTTGEVTTVGQRGFEAQLFGGISKPTSVRETFEVSFQIPPNAATGDYFLKIQAVANHRMIYYQSPGDFPQKIFHIDNPEHFPEPTIKSITELPH
jgi:hypothetical protein